MSRGMFIFIVIAVLLSAIMLWVVPAMKRKILGESLETRYRVLNWEDSYDVQIGEQIVARTVVELEITFPMGSAPAHHNELEVRDDAGEPIPVVIYPPPEKTDDEDKRETRWYLKSVYFPIHFRQGLIRTKHRPLVYLRLGSAAPVK